MANEGQRKRWNTPDTAALWPRRERITAVTREPLLDRLALRSGERVLDIGCGGGWLTIAAAQAVGAAGAAFGFDISAPLIGLASERAAGAGAANARFAIGDAQTDAIDGAPFDVATSQFGVMFFADPTAAFTNIRKHLSVGGRLAFVCWQSAPHNGWFPGRVLAPYAPPPPPANVDGVPPGPFAFGDAAYVSSILEGAGFASVAHVEQTYDVSVPDDTLFDAETVRDLNLDADRAKQASSDLAAFADSMRGPDGQLQIRLATQFVTATVA